MWVNSVLVLLTCTNALLAVRRPQFAKIFLNTSWSIKAKFQVKPHEKFKTNDVFYNISTPPVMTKMTIMYFEYTTYQMCVYREHFSTRAVDV